MNENQTTAYKLLMQAQLALKNGDANTASQLADQAVQIAPELEEVWMLKAALASPHDSVSYLQKALQINPNSVRAQKGLGWAQQRLQKFEDEQALAASGPQPAQDVVDDQRIAQAGAAETGQPASETQLPSDTELPVSEDQSGPLPEPIPGSPVSENQNEPAPEPIPGLPVPENQGGPAPEPLPDSSAPAEAEKKRRPFGGLLPLAAGLLVILLCLALLWAGLQSGSLASALLADPFATRPHGPAWGQAVIAVSHGTQPGQPTPADQSTSEPQTTSAPVLLSPTPADTSSVPAQVDTATPTSLPSETPQPTETQTLLPTDTPAPTDTYTPQVTNTPGPAQPSITPSLLPSDTVKAPSVDLPAAASPTLTPFPTFTSLPGLNTEVSSATPDMAPTFAQASPTPLPTDTSAPSGSTAQATPTPVPVTLPTPAAPPLTGIKGHWFDVDLTQQMLYAYDGDTLVKSFLVSTGTWQYPTVTGQYHIYVKYRFTDMSGPGYYLPNVPFTMYFYQGYGIHGTYWHHNFGHPMSHGCVNLSIPDSEWAFNFASVGTLVYVHN